VSKTITTSIEIDAAPEVVWRVLTDFASHPEWNPFIRQISGEVSVGSRLRVNITPPGGRGMTFKPAVTAATPDRELAWLGSLGVRGVFDGAHSFVLEDLGGGRTRVTQSETFGGVLVPFFGSGLDSTVQGFEQMNRALKDRCERVADVEADSPPQP